MKSLKSMQKKGRLAYATIALVLIVGIVARFYAMTKGHNFDFESYKIIGDIVTHGGNVYAETTRYNYGPIWFAVLGIFREISFQFTDPDLIFRQLIVGLLTLADIGIAYILLRKFGLLAAAIFFLNPISIVITGYHNQFDNVAILIGLSALLLLPDTKKVRVDKNDVIAAILIGLSLMTKHIFFALPLWLLIRGRSLRVKLILFLIPLAVFVVGFIPFWATGHHGIIHNVFMYSSFANASLLQSLFSPMILSFTRPIFLLVVMFVIVGFMTRRLPILESALWYLLVLVVFSPAIANQYLAIVMPAVAALGWMFFVPFIILAMLLLIVTSGDGLHIQRFVDNIPHQLVELLTPDVGRGEYRVIILALFVGMILAAIYRYKREWYVKPVASLRHELEWQLKSLKQ